MKKLFTTGLFVFVSSCVFAQVTKKDILGNWEVTKVEILNTVTIDENGRVYNKSFLDSISKKEIRTIGMPYDSFLRSWIQAELTFWEIGQYSAVDGHGKKGTGKYTLDNSILSLYTLDSYKVSIENNIMILTNRTKDNRKVIITCVRL